MELKKKIIVLTAAVIMAFSAMPLAFAEPEDGTTADAQQSQMDNSIAANAQQAAAQQAAANGVNTSSQSDVKLENSKYLTKGGAAFWYIFLFILNGAFSFWVGNRFYRLSKKDNHVSAEIRALRRDIEDKMLKGVDGFVEQDFDIENTNDSFAADDEGIKPVKKQTVVRELTPEEEERFRKWEEAHSKPKTETTVRRSHIREELDEELDDVKRINRKSYRPNRETEKEDTGADDLGETRVIKQPVGEGVKNKAKEIINDIFPFKED